jgi:hypothetical protein
MSVRFGEVTAVSAGVGRQSFQFVLSKAELERGEARLQIENNILVAASAAGIGGSEMLGGAICDARFF